MGSPGGRWVLATCCAGHGHLGTCGVLTSSPSTTSHTESAPAPAGQPRHHRPLCRHHPSFPFAWPFSRCFCFTSIFVAVLFTSSFLDIYQPFVDLPMLCHQIGPFENNSNPALLPSPRGILFTFILASKVIQHYWLLANFNIES